MKFFFSQLQKKETSKHTTINETNGRQFKTNNNLFKNGNAIMQQTIFDKQFIQFGIRGMQLSWYF